MWLQHKRVVMIASAVVFLVALLVIKNFSVFENIVNYKQNESAQDGLTYDSVTLADLTNKDTDGDGVVDWEEGLWGTNPNKKDSNDDGVPDNIEIEKMKKAKGIEDVNPKDQTATLTETDKFSHELFSTVAALNQQGTLDQDAIDQISNSLNDHLQTGTQKKTYTAKDIKISKDDSIATIKAYDAALSNTQKKYTGDKTVVDIFAKFSGDPENVDPAVLEELNPIIDQMQLIIDGMATVSVPQTFVLLHLNMMNSLEIIVENLRDIKLYDTDSIVALSAISQYENNMDIMQTDAMDLQKAIDQKLKN